MCETEVHIVHYTVKPRYSATVFFTAIRGAIPKYRVLENSVPDFDRR
jgi:hypothetical protein